MRAQHPGDLLHRLNSGADGLPAPLIEEFPRPYRRVIFPKLMEVFLKQVSPNCLEVVTKKIAQAKALVRGEIAFTLQYAPSRFLQYRLMSSGDELPCFRSPYLIERGIHFGDNVEAIQNVKRLRTFFFDHPKIRLPHVTADKFDLRR